MTLRTAGKTLSTPRLAPKRGRLSAETPSPELDAFNGDLNATRPPLLPPGGPAPPIGTPVAPAAAVLCRPPQAALPTNGRTNSMCSGSAGLSTVLVSSPQKSHTASTSNLSACSGASRSSTPRNNTGGSGDGSSPWRRTREDVTFPVVAPPVEGPTSEELRAENLRLRREMENLRQQLVCGVTSGTRSIPNAGAGFRGAKIRSEKKGSLADGAEVDVLHSVVRQKNQKITQMSQELASLQAGGIAQERSLSELQQCLDQASQQATATKERKREMEVSIQKLQLQLSDERQRMEAAQHTATEAAANNEDLSVRLAELRMQLESKHGALGDAERRAAELQAQLLQAQEAADFLKGEHAAERQRASAAEVFAMQQRSRASNQRRELGLKLLGGLGLRHALIRPFWDAWVQQVRFSRLEAELERSRLLIASEEASARAKSAEGRSARKKTENLGTELDELRAAWHKSESSCNQEVIVAAGLAKEVANAEAAADTLREAEASCAANLRRQLADAENEMARLRSAAGQVKTLRNELTSEQVAMSRLSDGSTSNKLREELTEEQQLGHELRARREAMVKSESSMKLELELANRQNAEQRTTLQQRVGTCEQQAREAQVSASSAQQQLATSRGRIAQLEQTIKEIEAKGQLSAADREKQLMREETLLREIRRLEQERDEARARPPPQPPPQPPPHRQQQRSQQAAGSSQPKSSPAKPESTAQAAQSAQVQELQGRLQQADDAVRQLKEELLSARKEGESVRAELLDARTDLSLEQGEVKKLRQVREGHETALTKAKADAAALQESRDAAEKWREAALEAAALVKSSLRILVTAPKVAINIGKNEVKVQKAISRDLAQIREVVGDRVLPTFQKIMAVAEEQGEDDVRGAVQRHVEDLALAVQKEVYRVLPQAEGTASWDGFGAKLTQLK